MIKYSKKVAWHTSGCHERLILWQTRPRACQHFPTDQFTAASIIYRLNFSNIFLKYKFIWAMLFYVSLQSVSNSWSSINHTILYRCNNNELLIFNYIRVIICSSYTNISICNKSLILFITEFQTITVICSKIKTNETQQTILRGQRKDNWKWLDDFLLCQICFNNTRGFTGRRQNSHCTNPSSVCHCNMLCNLIYNTCIFSFAWFSDIHTSL